MEDKGIEVIEAHSITEEAFENLGEESIPENISSKGALNKTQEKRTTLIDQTEKNPSNDCEKTEIFYCHSCGVDDWFDCLCSDSENESQSDKKAIEISSESKDLDNETKSDQKVIEVKEKYYFCNFNTPIGPTIHFSMSQNYPNRIHLVSQNN